MVIDLSLMRKRLEAKQAELQKNIRGLTEAHPEPVGAIEASEGPQDSEEVAVDFLETQQEQSLLVNEQALLAEVQSALERIENGTYGRCIDCGQPIPEKRLEAIPWAARCIKDEERLEERNLSIPRRMVQSSTNQHVCFVLNFAFSKHSVSGTIRVPSLSKGRKDRFDS